MTEKTPRGLTLIPVDPARAGELAAYIEALAPAERSGLGDLIDEERQVRHAHLSAAIERLRAHERGEQLPDGWVPMSNRWIELDGRIVGSLSFRHRLNDFLETYGGHVGYAVHPEFRRRGIATWALRQAMGLAREHGLTEILVTCDAANEGSRRTILACGGEMLGTVDDDGTSVERYRVAL